MVELTKNTKNEPSITKEFPIQYLNTDLVVPFYFDHHRISPNNKLNFLLFKSQLTTCLQQFVNNFNQFDSDNPDLVLTPYVYQEQYQHIDFLNRNQVFSYLIAFNEHTTISKYFNGADFHIYYDPKEDIVNGGITLHLNKISDPTFNSIINASYLHSLFEYFIETYYFPELGQALPNLIFANPVTANQQHPVYKDANKMFNLVDQTLKNIWIELVEDKLSSEYAYLKTDDYFYGIINTFMVSLYMQNILRHLIINQAFNDETISSFINNKNLIAYNRYQWIFNYLFTDNLQPAKYQQKKDLAYNNFKKCESLFNNLRISLVHLLYFHEMQFKDFANSWIVNHHSHISYQSDINLPYVSLVINTLLQADKFMLGNKSKFFINLSEFNKMISDLINNKIFIEENVKNAQNALFYSNNHFASYNNLNHLVLLSTNNSLVDSSRKQITYFYVLGMAYFGSFYCQYLALDNFALFLIQSGYTKKNFSYRKIVYATRILLNTLTTNLFGLNSIKYVVNRLDDQYKFIDHLNWLINAIRKEDEADKLIIERNSIATAFICALFVGIIWFVDQCFSTIDAMGYGKTGAQPGYTPHAVSYPMTYGFIALSVFIIAIITIILLYQCAKLYVTYFHTKNQGLLNLY